MNADSRVSPRTLRAEWTADEMETVLQNPRLSSRALGALLGRSSTSVLSKRNDLQSGVTRTGWWSDDELGQLQDMAHLPVPEAARILGRSVRSVGDKRRGLRDGWVPQKEAWSREDDQFIASTRHFTAEQVAQHLGRSVPAIQDRRHFLGVNAGRTRKRPQDVGGRRLVAKSCSRCGLVLDAKWFGWSSDRGGRYASECSRCSPPTPKQDRRGVKQDNSATVRLQALTLDRAARNGQPYTANDDAILADPDLTLLEKALSLQRTYYAAHNACNARGYSSKVGLGDQTKGQWHIHRAAA